MTLPHPFPYALLTPDEETAIHEQIRTCTYDYSTGPEVNLERTRNTHTLALWKYEIAGYVQSCSAYVRKTSGLKI